MNNLMRAACLGTLLALTGLATIAAAANAPAACSADHSLLSYVTTYGCASSGRTYSCPCKQFGAYNGPSTVSVNCPSGANTDTTQFGNGSLFKYPDSDLRVYCTDGVTWKGAVTKNGDGSSTIVYSIQK